MDIAFLVIAFALIAIVVALTIVAGIVMSSVKIEPRHSAGSDARSSERQPSEAHLSLYQPSNTDQT